MNRNEQSVRLDKEDRAYLANLPDIPTCFTACGYGIPEDLPITDIKTENQYQMGSCQGNSVTTVVERVNNRTGQPTPQLSRLYAYLASQRESNLLYRDQGSTISAGCKLAVEKGFPTESLIPYVRSYPNRSAINEVLRKGDASSEKYMTFEAWKVPSDPEKIRHFLAAGGGINIGILWPGIPRSRVIESFSRGRGGHAVAILGYKPGYFRFVNSHGDGEFLVSDRALMQMLAHSWTAAIGLTGSEDPVFDWFEESPWYFGR